MQPKTQLRKLLLKNRRQLTPRQRKKASALITQQIAHTNLFKNSQRVAFYMPANGEINPIPLLKKALHMRKKCYLPVLHPLKHNSLWFIEYRAKDPLTVNRYGILEPKINLRKKIPAWNLNLVLTPLIGFDIKGNRLGSGKGYYDRSFAFLNQSRTSEHPVLVGLAYELQKVADVETQIWDVPMKMIVTETTSYRIIPTAKSLPNP